MNREIKVLESKALANRLVLESLIKHLHASNIIDAKHIENDIEHLMSEPVSIGADPVNIASYKYELTDWHEVLGNICPSR
jgi:hypothetical protein